MAQEKHSRGAACNTGGLYCDQSCEVLRQKETDPCKTESILGELQTEESGFQSALCEVFYETSDRRFLRHRQRGESILGSAQHPASDFYDRVYR